MTNVPTYNDTIPNNTKYSIDTARRIMVEYILSETINKNKLPTFIRTNHENVRGLIDYNDKEFDKINKTAFEDVLNMDLEDFYGKDDTLAQNLLEDFGYSERTPLTLRDVLEGESLNFYSILDINDENVLRAIGKHGYKQFIKTGNMFNSIKSLFAEKVGEDGTTTSQVKANAKVIAREGWAEAILNDIFRALDGIEGAKYPKDFQRSSPPYIQLTEIEESQWGDMLAEWASDNGIKGLDTSGEIPRLPNNRRLILKEMTAQQYFDFLNVLGSLSPIKWKTFLRKVTKKWIEGNYTIPDTVKGERRALKEGEESVDFTGEQLGKLMNISDEYYTQINDYIDNLNPPEVVEVQRRGVEDVDLPEVGTRTRDTSMVERVETVSESSLKNVIRDHLVNSKGFDYDVKLSRGQRKYTLTTREQDWIPVDDFLDVKAGKKPYDKISSKGSFTSKMDIPVGGEYEETVEDIVDGLLSDLIPDKIPKEVTEFLDKVEAIQMSKDEIETYYTQITGVALQAEQSLVGEEEQQDLEDEGITGDENIIERLNNFLEPFMVGEEREEIVDGLRNLDDNMREDLRNLKDICGEISDVFGTYTDSVRNNESEDIVIEPTYSENQLKQLESYDELLDIDIRSLRNLTEPATIEEIESNFETLFETEEGKKYEEQYKNILDNRELDEGDFDNIRLSLSKFFNRSLRIVADKGKETVFSYLDMFKGESIIDKLVNIFYATLTNESNNPKQWGQPTKYTSAGKINFVIMITEKSSGVEAQAVSNYQQNFDIKIVSSLTGVDFATSRQKSFAQSEGAGKRTYNITTEGKNIAVKGKAVDKVRKSFIDKIEQRIQLLDMVI